MTEQSGIIPLGPGDTGTRPITDGPHGGHKPITHPNPPPGGPTPITQPSPEPPWDWAEYYSTISGSPTPTAANAALAPAPGANDVLPIVTGIQLVKCDILWQSGDSRTQTFLIPICEGEIASVDAVEINGSGQLTAGSNPAITWTLYAGTPAGSSDSWLYSVLPSAGATGQLPNTAWLKLQIQDPGSFNPNWTNYVSGGSVQSVSVLIHGRKLYDMRLDSTFPGGTTSKGVVIPAGIGSQRAGTPSTWAYTACPALVERDLLTNARWPFQYPTINDVSFAAAANICDSQVGSPLANRFVCNLYIQTQSAANSHLDQVRMTMNAEPFLGPSGLELWVDVADASSPVLALDTAKNFMFTSVVDQARADTPTQIVITYQNAAIGYATDTISVPTTATLIAAGTEIRQASYTLEACTDVVHATRTADYILNQNTVTPLRATGVVSQAGVTLTRGSLVTVKTSDGLAAQKFLVTDVQNPDTGAGGGAQSLVAPGGNGLGYSVTLRQYDASVYSGSAIETSVPAKFASLLPPPPAAPREGNQLPSIVFDAPRVYAGGTQYGTTHWTFTGTSFSDGTKINDGNYSVIAATVAGGQTATIDLDLGAGPITATHGKADIWIDQQLGGSGSYTRPVFIALYYSDNGSSWTSAQASVAFGSQTTPWQDAPSGICAVHIECPDAVGAHRYWRVLLQTAAPVTVNVYEIQWYTYSAYTGAIGGYEVRIYPGTFGINFQKPDPTQPVQMFTTTLPTDSSPLLGETAPVFVVTNFPVLPTQSGSSLTLRAAITTRSTFGLSSSEAVPVTAQALALPDAGYTGPTSVSPTAAISSVQVMIEQPTGVINGVNRSFKITQIPVTNRIVLISDGQPLVGGSDYQRNGLNVVFNYRANPPRVSLIAVYPYIGAPPIGGTIEKFPSGTASTWSGETVTSSGWRYIGWSPDLGQFAIVSTSTGSTSIATSLDGVTWTVATTPTTPSNGGWGCICWGNGQWLVMDWQGSSPGHTLTSPDGVTWTQNAVTGLWSGSTPEHSAVVWVQTLGLYIAIRETNSSPIAAYTSPDGLTWTSRNADAGGTAHFFHDMIWSEDLHLLVMVGSGGAIGTSPDGIAWTYQTVAGGAEWRSVTWSQELALFCTVQAGGVYATSPDGVTWTVGASTIPSAHAYYAVAWSHARQLFIALSGLATPADTTSIATSPDGSTWTLQTTPQGAWNRLAVAESINAVVAVAAAFSTYPIVMLSTS